MTLARGVLATYAHARGTRKSQQNRTVNVIFGATKRPEIASHANAQGGGGACACASARIINGFGRGKFFYKKVANRFDWKYYLSLKWDEQ